MAEIFRPRSLDEVGARREAVERAVREETTVVIRQGNRFESFTPSVARRMLPRVSKPQK